MGLPPPRPPQTRAGRHLRTWTSTCSRCRRATASLLSASLTTASRSPRSPPGCRPMRAGTLRAGGRESSTPGTGMAPGSPAPASLHGGLPAGTKASPRWKGSSSSWLTASSPRPASPAWAWALGASCTQTRWTTPGGPTAWMPSSRSSSISLKTQAPRLQTKRRSRPSPPSPSLRNMLRAGVPRVQGRLRVGGAGAAAALQSSLPRRLHRALAAAARQLPCVPEKSHGTEHGHQPPRPDRRELLVVLVLLVLQLAEQRKPSRQLLSPRLPPAAPTVSTGPHPHRALWGGGRGAPRSRSLELPHLPWLPHRPPPRRGQRLGGPPPPGWHLAQGPGHTAPLGASPAPLPICL
ncbi:E3 ubiquitin-protein ligase RNF126 isoform X1 [Enhydra lutris kenyoni]|uniref:E3 ubiquitin-protein ligase RNF126 isoform X1 n=1 Tax=Enhydra lutris kenyoni TaxID=391180 RepID=A0A2Y9L888_ENHLU|nr:E3 ubiquitin-protein ligase RNF126 isoform X1 [Enhydra lutris kenyoni]